MDQLSAAFSALGDPTRRAILERLMDGEASFSELADPCDMSRPAVVKHLRALERAGLIRKEGAKARPVYRLAPEGLKTPSDWLDRYARYWEDALDRLDAYIRDRESSKGGSR
jgi:DNA-binding transcriptional ArsR family regulator